MSPVALIPRIESLLSDGAFTPIRTDHLAEIVEALRAASNLSLAAKVAIEEGMFEVDALDSLEHHIREMDVALS